MLIIIGLISTTFSLWIVQNSYNAKKAQMSKSSAMVHYTQEQRDNWKKEYVWQFILACVPVIFCTVSQIIINSL